ncbi:unknown protein [Microcystis aeruginosa NIES-843]|jgi:hypothetical protein|uniref:Uncharacterized protein n=1 Tax=Microcystis aeruginosa (strain NIES-843 / IAM M-2473) TaxID=449447 RepID=B0JPU7_MICAN|nr:unknown protein [Microcystis aeruginosa NIES-843]
MYGQPPVSIPLAPANAFQRLGETVPPRTSDSKSVFSGTINCQSNLKNPLPSPHFPLPTPQRRVWGVESPKSQRLSDKIGNNSQF